MHKSSAQVKDGVLCRDTEDSSRFFLIAEWSDIGEHARIRRILANEIKPDFIKLIEGGRFVPKIRSGGVRHASGDPAAKHRLSPRTLRNALCGRTSGPFRFPLRNCLSLERMGCFRPLPGSANHLVPERRSRL